MRVVRGLVDRRRRGRLVVEAVGDVDVGVGVDVVVLDGSAADGDLGVVDVGVPHVDHVAAAGVDVALAGADVAVTGRDVTVVGADVAVADLGVAAVGLHVAVPHGDIATIGVDHRRGVAVADHHRIGVDVFHDHVAVADDGVGDRSVGDHTGVLTGVDGRRDVVAGLDGAVAAVELAVPDVVADGDGPIARGDASGVLAGRHRTIAEGVGVDDVVVDVQVEVALDVAVDVDVDLGRVVDEVVGDVLVAFVDDGDVLVDHLGQLGR